MDSRRGTAVLLLACAALAVAAWPAPAGAAPAKGKEPFIPVEIRGNQVEYSGREGKVVFRGDVTVKRGSATLHSDELVTLRGPNEAVARGHVSVKDTERSTDLTCDEVTYTHGMRNVKASGTCHLISGEGDEMTIVSSDEMEVVIEKREAVARGRVRIEQGPNGAECGEARLYGSANRLVLVGSPVLRHPPHEFRADEVISYFKEGRVVLNGNVRATLHTGRLEELEKGGVR